MVLILTTVPDAKTASRIARKLVEGKYAACVSVIGNVSSVYRWKKKIETAKEHLLLVKTSHSRYKKCEKFICSVHPYAVPEILSVPVLQGLGKYLAWLGESLK